MRSESVMIVWIRGHVFVLADVTIGEGSTTAAGSVATEDIPSYSVAVGNPCRVERKIQTVKEEEKELVSEYNLA